MPKKRSPLNFEEALDELEQVVARMEQGELSLEDSLKNFERGVELSRICQKALEAAEKRIQILTERNGSADLEDFAPDGD